MTYSKVEDAETSTFDILKGNANYRCLFYKALYMRFMI